MATVVPKAWRLTSKTVLASGQSAVKKARRKKKKQLQAELQAERDARQMFEERVRQLEKHPPTGAVGTNSGKKVDKNIAVIGGFAERFSEETEHLVREMMTHVFGFEDVSMTSSSPAIALVRFQSHYMQNHMLKQFHSYMIWPLCCRKLV